MSKRLQMIALENEEKDEKIRIEYHASARGSFVNIPNFPFIAKSKMVLKYVDKETGEESEEEYSNKASEDKLAQIFEDGKTAKSASSYKNPTISYEDITEQILLGSKSISQEYLVSRTDGNRGLWGNIGIRKWKIVFSNASFADDSPKDIKVRIDFLNINGEKCKHQNFTTEWFALEKTDGNTEIIIDLDTNLLGNVFTNTEYKEKESVLFAGEIEVRSDYTNNRYVLYKYPIELTLINTDPNVCKMISRKAASVDFGTSSTCVAIDGDEGTELLSLSPEDGDSTSGNIFENPTNIMVYNWEELRKEWRIGNENMPILYKGDKTKYLEASQNAGVDRVDFDFGYKVKEILGEDDVSKKELNAILSLLKMIPYQIEQEKRQMAINPYNDKDCHIDIVKSPIEEDDKHFNPVAFYGYLIGRAVNDLSKHMTIYTKFQVTSPVMFNENIKKLLCTSLKEGIRRSVPGNLKESVNVTMKYTEPVAYMGAVCGTEYFPVEENAKECFAVYDFGGGTLDFSYGVAKDEDGELTLQVLDKGGEENIGGENLIEQIAYEIYDKNKPAMKEGNIPIDRPIGALKLEDVSEDLLKTGDLSRANMNIICAKAARKIFEDPEYNGNSVSVELYDLTGNPENVELKFQLDDIKDKLEQIIRGTIENFKREMLEAFKNETDFDEKTVYIFKAGNSSRNEFVDKIMEDEFPQNNRIKLVDETAKNDDKVNKRYAITPKTAVAFGQLKLNNIEIEGDDATFRYYLGYFTPGKNKFKVCVDKNAADTREWHKFQKIKNDQIDVFYARSMPADGDYKAAKHVTLDVTGHVGDVLFIRILNDSTFQYCIGNSDNPAGLPEDVSVGQEVLN